MAWNFDARTPVRLVFAGGEVPSGAGVVLEGDAAAAPSGLAAVRFDLPTTGHAVGCACCAPRNPAAVALDRLFLGRVRGEVPDFREVAAVVRTEAGAAAVRAALATDPVVAARFRAAYSAV